MGISKRSLKFAFISKSDSEPDLDELLKNPLAIDCETAGDKLLGVALSSQETNGYYFPWCEENSQFLYDILHGRPAIGHSIKFDLKALKREGIWVVPTGDTMILAHLLEESSLALKNLVSLYLGTKIMSFEDLVGKNGTLEGLPLEIVGRYSAIHAVSTLRLYEKLMPLAKDKELLSLYENLEVPLISVLASMEDEGVMVDVDGLKLLRVEFEERVQIMTEALSYWGGGINFNSHKQVSKLFFDDLKLPVIGRTKKTHSPSTRGKDLERLRGKHPAVNLLLNLREDQKILDTHIAGLLKAEVNGRVHTDFSQTTVPTGRLSSKNPNLQNVPVRKSNILRNMIIAKPGHTLLSMDFKQIEPRILAVLSQEEEMIKAFLAKRDIYEELSEMVTGNREQRFLGKQLELSTIYGAGVKKFAEMANLSTSNAERIRGVFFGRFPRVLTWTEEVKREARRTHKVRTLGGRIRTFKNEEDIETEAVNTKVQGYAAEVCKKSMLFLAEALEPTGANMILQIHDELLVETPLNMVEGVIEILGGIPGLFNHAVPFTISIKKGNRWGTMEPCSTND